MSQPGTTGVALGRSASCTLRPSFELVACHELVLELEDQHQEDEQAAGQWKAERESAVPDVDLLQAENENHQRDGQHDASRRGQLSQQALDEPPDPSQDAPHRLHGGELAPVVVRQIEGFEIGERPADGALDAALADVVGDDVDVGRQGLEQRRRRAGRAAPGRPAHACTGSNVVNMGAH